jgi:hypothetical protein
VETHPGREKLVREICVLADTIGVLPGSHLLAALTAAAFLLIYVGVVLPAVWSGKPARRAAAQAVLQQIIDLLRRPRSESHQPLKSRSLREGSRQVSQKRERTRRWPEKDRRG